MVKVLSRSRLEDLKPSELRFIKELIADDLWRPAVAARKAGYKNPSQSAQQLISKPRVAQALGREQRRRLERLELKADEVLNVLATGLFFNPLSLFKPSADGKWVVEDLDKVPNEIGRCIEEVKSRTVESMSDDGTVTSTTYFELKLMSKTKLLELAMKHCGVAGDQKVVLSGDVGVNVGFNGDLSNLLFQVEASRSSQIIDDNVIEGKVLGVEHVR